MSDANRRPNDDELVIHFVHVAYRLAERSALHRTRIEHHRRLASTRATG